MGTSVSQSSPRTAKWKPVHVCYSNDIIPEEMILSEVWKAADNPTESIQWSKEMKSDIIFACLETVKTSSNIQEALKKFNAQILSTKSNSIVAEFAKRAIPIAYQGSDPEISWRNKFVSEVTSYIISRDTSGFVGKNYRNKNISDLEGFKNRLNTDLNKLMSSQNRVIQSQRDWNDFIDTTVTKLKSNR